MTKSSVVSSLIPHCPWILWRILIILKQIDSVEVPSRKKYHFIRNPLPLRGFPRASSTLVSGSASQGNYLLQIYHTLYQWCDQWSVIAWIGVSASSPLKWAWGQKPKFLRNVNAVFLLIARCLSSGHSNVPPSPYNQGNYYFVPLKEALILPPEFHFSFENTVTEVTGPTRSSRKILP